MYKQFIAHIVILNLLFRFFFHFMQFFKHFNQFLICQKIYRLKILFIYLLPGITIFFTEVLTRKVDLKRTRWNVNKRVSWIKITRYFQNLYCRVHLGQRSCKYDNWTRTSIFFPRSDNIFTKIYFNLLHTLKNKSAI